MTTPSTYYTGRSALPDFIVRGADTVLSMSLYLDGAKVAVSSATLTVYNESGTAVLSAVSASIASNTASYTVTAATTATLSLSPNWRVEWAMNLTAGGVEVVKNDAQLVRTVLRPVITDADLYRRVSGLDASDANALSSKADYQDFLDEAWVEINQRLIEIGNRPALIGSPSSVRGAHLYLTLALVFEDMATRAPEAYSDRASMYRKQYEGALQRLTFKYPEDEYGNTPGRGRAAATGPMFLCGIRSGGVW